MIPPGTRVHFMPDDPAATEAARGRVPWVYHAGVCVVAIEPDGGGLVFREEQTVAFTFTTTIFPGA